MRRHVAALVAGSALLLTACGTPAPPSSTSPTSVSADPSGSATVPTSSPSGSPSPSASPGGATAPSSPTAPASSVVYATGFRLSGDTLSFQPITWYEGARAQARCKVKKIKSETEWCNDYYYENAGTPLSASLAPQVSVKLIGESSTPSVSTRSNLVAALHNDEISYATLSRTDGAVVAFDEIFTP